jgi:hypothetical protein
VNDKCKRYEQERREEAARAEAQNKPTWRPPAPDLNERLLKHAQELRTHADCIEALVERAGVTKSALLDKVRELRAIAQGILTGTGQMVEMAEESQ